MRIVKEIGSLVLLKAMAERMNIRGLIDALIPMERERGLTHGQVFEACVINRCHAPVPLYEMEGSRKLMTDVPSRVLKTGMRGE
jgi:hypothetical protein